MLQAFSDLKAGGHSLSANSFFIIMGQKLAIATYGTGAPIKEILHPPLTRIIISFHRNLRTSLQKYRDNSPDTLSLAFVA